MILLLLGLALAEPPPGLSPTAEALWVRAEQLQESGDPERAARLFRSLHVLDGRAEAAVAAADAFVLAGDPARAEAVLVEATSDPEVRLALAALLLARGATTEAAGVAREAEAIWGRDARAAAILARALAVEDPDGSLAALARWLDEAAPDAIGLVEAVDLATEVARARLDAADPLGATAALDLVAARVPGAALRLAGLRDEAAMRGAALQLARLAPTPLRAEHVEIAASARAALAAGRVAEARALLEPLVDRVPGHPELRGLRARARRLSGAPAAAEADLRAAEALDPLDARWPAELGDLIDEAWAGRFAAESFEAWGRALQLRPDQPELRARWARLGLTLGRTAEVEAAVATSADPALAPIRASLDLERESPAPLTGEPGCPATVSPQACEGFYLAYAFARRGAAADPITGRPADRDRALALVQAARALAPTWVRPVNLEASLLLGEPGQRTDEARALLERSLAIEADQPEVLIALGRLLEAAGEREAALSHWRRAVESPSAASAPAHLYLAEQAWRGFRPDRAAEHLARYRERALVHDPTLARRAQGLERNLTLARTAGWGSGALLLFALGSGLAVLGWRRARRGDLGALLWADRGCWRELAAIAASIRHEVLKHELGALAEVATALEAGDPEPARWLAQRVGGPDGALARARERLVHVERLGRARGIILDLSRDATFAPLLRTLDALDSLLPALSRGSATAAEVRALDAAIRGPVDAALRDFVHRVSSIRLDRGLLHEAIERARTEGGVADRQGAIGGIDVPEGLVVRGFREDLLEIVVNLVRNALAAGEGSTDAAIAVRVEVEEDPITAMQTVAIRVADRVEQPLTTEMIRSRYVERGLGLTVARATAMGGLVTVEPEVGYAKAVVVRLPRVERDALETTP